MRWVVKTESEKVVFPGTGLGVFSSTLGMYRLNAESRPQLLEHGDGFLDPC